MTASSRDDVWSLPARVAAQFEPGLRAVPDARWRDALVDETVTLRRCAQYRKAFRGSATSYPVDALRLAAVADWIRRHGVAVDVTSTEELEYALSAGISPLRIVMHRLDGTAGPIRRAVNAEVGGFVVNSEQQFAILASSTERTQRILVDVTARPADELASAVLLHGRLDLIGLHHRLGDGDNDDVADAVRELIARMAGITHQHGTILTRLSLADFDAVERCGDPRGLRRLAEAIDDAVEDGCIRYRFPRPALTMSPSRATILPAA